MSPVREELVGVLLGGVSSGREGGAMLPGAGDVRADEAWAGAAGGGLCVVPAAAQGGCAGQAGGSEESHRSNRSRGRSGAV